jgi:hypothetical protein
MYNLQQNRWINIPSLQNEREGLSLCVVQDRYIYAFGNVTTRGKRFKYISQNNDNSSTSQN